MSHRRSAFLLPVLTALSVTACTSPRPKVTVEVPLILLEPVVDEDEGLRFEVRERQTLAYLDTIEYSPNVQALTPVTESEDPGFQIGPPVLSPTSEDLAYRIYTLDDDGISSNIWSQPEDSSGRTCITVGTWIDDTPCFTPDGEHILFSSNRTGPDAALWRVRTEGSGGITRLTDSNAADYAPSVSPDGETVAYASLLRNAQAPQVWTTRATGGLVTQLREGTDPEVSPDGALILFTRKNAAGHSQIWTMTIEGGQETQLTLDEEIDHLDPSWSPDGEHIVYASNVGLDPARRNNFDIWMMASDGTQPTSLTTNGSWDDGPCWNHTGERIYFRSNRGGAWNLWRFELSQVRE